MTSSYSFLYRENRVPHYQRLFQKNDGVRQWNKVRAGAFRFFVSLAIHVEKEHGGMKESGDICIRSGA